MRKLKAKNFTVFRDIDLSFGKNLNVFVGENGTGKTHLLKLAYSMLYCNKKSPSIYGPKHPRKHILEESLARHLVEVLQPDDLGRLVSPAVGHSEIEIVFDKSSKLNFVFSTKSRSKVQVRKLHPNWLESEPVFLTSEGCWGGSIGDVTRSLLARPKLILKKEAQNILDILESSMGGSMSMGSRLFLEPTKGHKIESALVSDGVLKLGFLSLLVANGTLKQGSKLFLDGAEASLNPRLIRVLVQVIRDLCRMGVQVFLSTHSLFLLRELELETLDLDARYFGFHFKDGVSVLQQGPTSSDIGNIVILDEELEQSGRYMESLEE